MRVEIAQKTAEQKLNLHFAPNQQPPVSLPEAALFPQQVSKSGLKVGVSLKGTDVRLRFSIWKGRRIVHKSL